MLSQDLDATSHARLQAIANLLGVEPEAFKEPPKRGLTFQLLALCLELPNEAEQVAALAYLRLLKLGIPK